MDAHSAKLRIVDDKLRILIVRLSSLGDIIHTMPLACALRDCVPQAAIGWLVEDRFAELLEGHRAVDVLLTVRRRWLCRPREVLRLRSQLRRLRFDLTIDAQGLTKSALAAWLSGARRRIGYGNPWGRELSRWLNNELVDTRSVHAVDRHLELLGPLGVSRSAVDFSVPVDAHTQAEAKELLTRLGISGYYVVIHPGASRPNKRWPVERYAAVAVHMVCRWRLPVVVLSGNQAERRTAEQLAAALPELIRPAPPLSLKQLAAVLRGGRLYLGSDSGPLHLAAAVGVPCVGLYGPWPAEGHGPYGPQHIAVQKAVCPGGTRRRRRASSRYIEAIDVESVCWACDTLLERQAISAA